MKLLWVLYIKHIFISRVNYTLHVNTRNMHALNLNILIAQKPSSLQLPGCCTCAEQLIKNLILIL